MKEHHVKISKTAHYSTLGEPGPHIKKCWIITHGYGQLASEFIKDFKILEAADTLVIAPEGLSRFYWGGFVGPVVSSWMTSKDRLDEIEDYCNFIQGLYDAYIPQLSPDVQITLLGFSQGTATQCRWIHRNRPFYHRLILWAGMLPDDLNFQAMSDYFSDKDLYFVYGTQDRFLTAERLEWQRSFAKQNGLEFKEVSFAGKHKIQELALKDFLG